VAALAGGAAAAVTVAYRVKRAEDLLGHGVTGEPVELTCALTLAAVLGSAVLTGGENGVLVGTPQAAD
jgi:hypothetical protein